MPRIRMYVCIHCSVEGCTRGNPVKRGRPQTEVFLVLHNDRLLSRICCPRNTTMRLNAKWRLAHRREMRKSEVLSRIHPKPKLRVYCTDLGLHAGKYSEPGEEVRKRAYFLARDSCLPFKKVWYKNPCGFGWMDGCEKALARIRKLQCGSCGNMVSIMFMKRNMFFC